MYPDDLRVMAINLNAEGLTARQISERLDVNLHSVAKWIQRARAEQDDASAMSSVEEQDDGSTISPVEERATGDLTARRRPTVIEVAERAGVSISTVSNYLNNRGRMGDEARDRIKTAMAALNYTPNSLVRAIRQRRTRILGVVPFGMHDLHVAANPTAEILSGIQRAVSIRGYNLLIYTNPLGAPQETGLEFLDGHIDGLLWVSPGTGETRLETVVRAGLPAVALLAGDAPAGAGFVAVDNIGGMRSLVAHLVKQGHRRIAYIGPNYAADFLERIEGYTRAHVDCGLTVDRRLLATGTAINRDWYDSQLTEDYESTVDRWLKLLSPPTAIMLSTDGWAAWMINHLRKRGIRVPEDIAVTGFDDALPARSTPGGITTVRQDFLEMGRLGAKLLMDFIDGAPVESRRVRQPTEIIVRGSTSKLGGCPVEP